MNSLSPNLIHWSSYQTAYKTPYPHVHQTHQVISPPVQPYPGYQTTYSTLMHFEPVLPPALNQTFQQPHTFLQYAPAQDHHPQSLQTQPFKTPYKPAHLNTPNTKPHQHQASTAFSFSGTNVTKVLKGVALTTGAIGLGVLLRKKLPNLNKPNSIIPTDWKTYAQIGLGVFGVKSLNDGLGIKMPPWATAIETTALLQPMMMGFKPQTFRQLPLMAAYVGSLVGGTNWTVNKFDETVGQKYNIPKWVPKTALWATSIIGGARLYPTVSREVAKTGLMGQALQKKAMSGDAFVSSAGGAAAGIMCANGCCPSAICAVEVGDAIGSLASGHLSEHFHKKSLA